MEKKLKYYTYFSIEFGKINRIIKDLIHSNIYILDIMHIILSNKNLIFKFQYRCIQCSRKPDFLKKEDIELFAQHF